MLFQRFEAKGLSHFSYALACPTAKQMAVVDPQRDVDTYVEFAKANGLQITHVLETHVHADYASGARELAERTGATLCVSQYDKGETFEVSHPHRDLADGDRIDLGQVRLEAVYTPGHTPEHMSYLVYDKSHSQSEPAAMLTGDFLFVGSLGRPDLLGEEAKHALAERLFESVRERLKDLPDALPVYPAHGAGSMCGAGLSNRPSSTLGDERLSNPFLDKGLTKEAFVERILSTVPPFPAYYRRMKRVNSEGAPAVETLSGTAPIDGARFRELVDAGHVVIDLRDQLAFGEGHVPNSFGIGVGNILSTWASWVVPYDTPILLVAPDESLVEKAIRALVRVGLDDVRGYLEGGFEAWRTAGGAVQTTPQIPPVELHQRLQAGANICVIDVRGDREWESGHVPGALHLMCGTLSECLEKIPRDGRPVAMICGGGYRSTVAASVLERAGIPGAINVTGGMGAWQRSGLPTTLD